MRSLGPSVLLMALAATPAPAQAVLGQWDGTRYLAPGGAFGFTPPALSGDATSIQVSDARPDPNTLLVQVGDQLCRRFVVVETQSASGGAALDAWVQREVLGTLDPARTDSLDRRARTTPFGRAIELRWVARRGAPCTEVNVTSTGRRTDPVQPDADVGMIAFRLPGRYVRLIYLMGRSAQTQVVEGVARGPMEAMLDAMVAGFEPVP